MSVQILIVSCLISLSEIHHVSSDAVPAWTYIGQGSQSSDWASTYETCAGKMQSPINIETKKVLYSQLLPYFDLSDYTNQPNVNMTLVNKGGHTAEVMFSGESVYMREGGLPDLYAVDQFHFHWGKTDSKGSEHSIDGKIYPMEMHIVHYQQHLQNVSNAANRPFGLAVLGFFVEIGDNNDNFDQILDHIHLITDANTSVTIPAFPLADLLPTTDNVDFFRYHGSLTTPPCSETVIWSLATETITISEDQLNKFRSLKNENNSQLVDDFRATQDLNKRTVTTTHKMYQFTTCSCRQVGSCVLTLVVLLLVAGLLGKN